MYDDMALLADGSAVRDEEIVRERQVRARRYVHAHAQDLEDAVTLLAALGLDEVLA